MAPVMDYLNLQDEVYFVKKKLMRSLASIRMIHFLPK